MAQVYKKRASPDICLCLPQLISARPTRIIGLGTECPVQISHMAELVSWDDEPSRVSEEGSQRTPIVYENLNEYRQALELKCNIRYISVL